MTVGLFATETVLSESNHHSQGGELGAGFVVVSLVVGVIVARHVPRNPIGWLLLSIPAAVGAFTLCEQVALATYRHHPLVAAFAGILSEASYFCFLFSAPLVLLFFPDGELPSPRWRRVLQAYLVLVAGAVIAALAWGVTVVLRGSLRFDSNGDLAGKGPGRVVSTVLIACVIGCLVLALSWVVRRIAGYRHATGLVRQQFKWLALGAMCLVVALVVSFISPSTPSTTATVENVLTDVLALPFPLTVGIAILRYRLYDIERVISRTLSYALLTGLLVGVYAALVTLITRVLPFSSPVAVAASTLVAVALFNPLRRQVQRLVDRRFNRSRYDAERTLGTFRSQVRGAVDLAAIQDHLVNAVHEALEPARVAVWVRPKDPR